MNASLIVLWTISVESLRSSSDTPSGSSALIVSSWARTSAATVVALLSESLVMLIVTILSVPRYDSLLEVSSLPRTTVATSFTFIGVPSIFVMTVFPISEKLTYLESAAI